MACVSSSVSAFRVAVSLSLVWFDWLGFDNRGT